MKKSNPVHQLEEPQPCGECRGDGYSLKGNKCWSCDGEGGWPRGWYFWDEVWVHRHGSYKSEEEANGKCREYARQL